MTLDRFSDMEQIRILWNTRAAEVLNLSDDEIIARIQQYKAQLQDLKVTIEASETELERRGRKKRNAQFETDLKFDNKGAIQDVEERAKAAKKSVKSIDGAIQALMSLGLSEEDARAKLAGMK